MRACITLIGSTLVLGAGSLSGQEPARPTCEQAPAEGRAAVVGRLTDEKTRLPLQEAPVVVDWNGSRRKVEIETDEAGVYRACDLPGGDRVRITASFGPANDNMLIDLTAGETHQQDFTLNAPRSRAAGRVVVHGTSRAIEAAEVRIEGSDVRAVTGRDGAFQLPDVPAGRYPLLTSHIGYSDRQDTIEVSYGAIMRYTITLAEQPIVLAPIEVAVRSITLEQQGFYERQERGFGVFLTRQAWEHRHPMLSSDVLRNVPGVTVARRRGGYGNVVLDRSNCAYRYVLDGIRVSETFQMDDMPPEWIEAIEVYRGAATVPPQFHTPTISARATCGVIVIWTRPPR
jgi:hypothetical protein